MITIRNSQRSIPVNTKQLAHNVQTILDYLGYSDFDLGIWITTNKTIRKYNKMYRNKDKATDILSFPYYPGITQDQLLNIVTQDEKNLGDIILSVRYIKDHAHEWNQSFDQRMSATVVHGICHLIGYTHTDDEKEDVMKRKEEELLRIIT